jgi:hypothetical protein
VLKTDVRMPQQICFVTCGPEELARHGARRQQAADSTGRSTAHEHQHGRACPFPQRDRPADNQAWLRCVRSSFPLRAVVTLPDLTVVCQRR